MLNGSADHATKLESFLVEGEVVENHLKLCQDAVDCDVYTTSKRLFIFRGMSITDILYRYVSSIHIVRKKKPELIVLGFLLALAGVIIYSGVLGSPLSGIKDGAAAAAVILGLVCIVFGILYAQRDLELNVLGVPKPVLLSGGSKDVLESLFKIIRDKRA